MSAWVPVVSLRSRRNGWSWGWKTSTDRMWGPSGFVGVGYPTRDEAWRAAVADLRRRGWDGVVVGYTEATP